MANRVARFAGLLDPQQGAVADAGDLVRTAPARNAYANPRSRAVLHLVPFARQRDQLAVRISLRDIREHHGRQRSRVMQFLAATLDLALVRELAQHAPELGAVGILHAEGAGDFAGAYSSALRADEGEDVVLGRN